MSNWITQTIDKHVIAEQSLSSRSEGIRVDESAQFGIVISALEIVESGLSIVSLATGPKTGHF